MHESLTRRLPFSLIVHSSRQAQNCASNTGFVTLSSRKKLPGKMKLQPTTCVSFSLLAVIAVVSIVSLATDYWYVGTPFAYSTFKALGLNVHDFHGGLWRVCYKFAFTPTGSQLQTSSVAQSTVYTSLCVDLDKFLSLTHADEGGKTSDIQIGPGSVWCMCVRVCVRERECVCVCVL